MGGLAVSIIVFATGAILDFAITTSPYQHGLNLNTVGVILMIVGAVGFVVSLLVWGIGDLGGWYGTRRRRTVVDDGAGHVVRREETYR
jgi:uncharacterized membrane protein YdbT with pleckstrin-like domain